MFCYLFTFPNTFIHNRFSQKPPTASTLRSAFINDFLLRFPDQASPNQVYIRSITVFLLPRAVDIFIVNISFHVATINARPSASENILLVLQKCHTEQRIGDKALWGWRSVCGQFYQGNLTSLTANSQSNSVTIYIYIYACEYTKPMFLMVPAESRVGQWMIY